MMPTVLPPAHYGLAWALLRKRADAVHQNAHRLEGIALGGCVDAIGTGRMGAMRPSAHAHTDARDQYRGWICVKSTKESRVITPTGRPTTLFAHEFAHIATGQGHTKGWRQTLAAIGFPAEARRYERNTR